MTEEERTEARKIIDAMRQRVRPRLCALLIPIMKEIREQSDQRLVGVARAALVEECIGIAALSANADVDSVGPIPEDIFLEMARELHQHTRKIAETVECAIGKGGLGVH